MIVLGNVESSYIKITPLDLNETQGWFQADIQIKVNCFSGGVDVYIEHHDLQNFHSQLKNLYKTLKGSAELIPTERQFIMKLSGNGRGQINVEGEAFEKATYGSCLQFDFELDQTYLPEFIESLKSVLP